MTNVIFYFTEWLLCTVSLFYFQGLQLSFSEEEFKSSWYCINRTTYLTTLTLSGFFLKDTVHNPYLVSCSCSQDNRRSISAGISELKLSSELLCKPCVSCETWRQTFGGWSTPLCGFICCHGFQMVQGQPSQCMWSGVYKECALNFKKVFYINYFYYTLIHK